MLLSRFWYVLLSLVIAALTFVLFIAQSMFNRSLTKDVAQGLQSDAQVVSWYLANDGRERAAHLIKFAVDGGIAKSLSKASSTEGSLSPALREEVRKGLLKVSDTIPKESAFDAVFAVDQHGRVVSHLGYEQASGMDHFELGGYPVVADALHGYIRDDTLVLDRVYRVVARPIEYEAGNIPAGAIIGARIIDDRFARELSTRTGAAVAFYSMGQRIASGAPPDFEKSQLDMIVNDLEEAQGDDDYSTVGRSSVRRLGKTASVVYSRLPGEAWALGAGFVVGRMSELLDSPFAFFKRADDKDKATVSLPLVIGIVFAGVALGILFSFIEYNRPLSALRAEVRRFAKGEVDHIAPSKLGGAYRTVASDLNDGIDVLVGKAGGTRRAADLQHVLGELPAEPAMSAFAVPGPDETPIAPPPASAPAATTPASPKPLPRPPGRLPSAPSNPKLEAVRAPQSSDAVPSSQAATQPVGAPGADQTSEWNGVYESFVRLKEECGESVDGFTYEKFEKTLEKHQAAIIQRHGVAQVKFSVYVKDGKAALKASPQRG
jgi:hypothetical protein